MGRALLKFSHLPKSCLKSQENFEGHFTSKPWAHGHMEDSWPSERLRIKRAKEEEQSWMNRNGTHSTSIFALHVNIPKHVPQERQPRKESGCLVHAEKALSSPPGA